MLKSNIAIFVISKHSGSNNEDKQLKFEKSLIMFMFVNFALQHLKLLRKLYKLTGVQPKK